MENLRLVWPVKVSILELIVTSIFFRCASAVNNTVGGPSGWDLASNMLIWSTTNTFHVGDTLVFNYSPMHDVIEVHEPDYATCIISNPIRTHRDGETVILLTEPGTRYFVCGRLNHCLLGLKLKVMVLPQFKDGGGSDNGSTSAQFPPQPRHSSPLPASQSPPPLPPLVPPSGDSQVEGRRDSRETPAVSVPPEGYAEPEPTPDHSGATDYMVDWVLVYQRKLPLITFLVIVHPIVLIDIHHCFIFFTSLGPMQRLLAA